VQIGMVPWDALPNQLQRSERGQRGHSNQGGHFMRWDDSGPKKNKIGQGDNDTSKRLMDTPEKRQRMWALTIVDSFTSNGDRHGWNAVIDGDGGVVAIDSGFADGWHREGWEADGQFGPFSFRRVAYSRSTQSALQKSIDAGDITADEVRDEAREWFKNSWNPEALSDVASAFVGKANAPNNLDLITEEDFVDMVNSNYLN